MLVDIVQGKSTAKFQPLRDAFTAIFAEEQAPAGAALCAYADGNMACDLWAGFGDPMHQIPWSPDGLCGVMSTTKGFAALTMHMLADRGLLDLSAPVAAYWPEFAHNAKSDVLIHHVLTHRAGIPVVSDDAVSLGGDHARWVFELERAPLRSAPGTECRYHAITQGFILGEIVRRVTGTSLGRFFDREVARPLGADFFVGLGPEQEKRIIETIRSPATDLTALARDAAPDSMFFPIRQLDLSPSSPEFRRSEIPASNGFGSARGVARIYAALSMGGVLDGIHIVSEHQVLKAGALASDAIETSTNRHWRLSHGFYKDCESISFDGKMSAFGHPGFGGCFGMCDPQARVALAFVLNEPPSTDHFARAKRLCRALYQSIGE